MTNPSFAKSHPAVSHAAVTPTSHWDEIKDFADPADHVSKYVFVKPDCAVEAVLYKYPEFEERTVICCSTMSGCPIGCRFCGTGDFFVRNLTADEIVSQPQYLLENCIGGLEPKRRHSSPGLCMLGNPYFRTVLAPLRAQFAQL